MIITSPNNDENGYENEPVAYLPPRSGFLRLEVELKQPINRLMFIY